MLIEGNIVKMKALQGKVVKYYLPLGESPLLVNEILGEELILTFDGRINCIHCGQLIKKTYGQGYCYPCFISVPETEECVLQPELCKAHLGVSRDMDWAREHCLQEHFVYLAISSGLKVGVTRKSQIPVRWINQGAIKAIKLAKTPNRFYAGEIEVELKKYMPDKTNWRNMLTNNIEKEIDLVKEKLRVKKLLPSGYSTFISDDDEVYVIEYPVINYPSKVSSLNLDKTNTFKGTLSGIKGQYFIFQGGSVFNIWKHSGYYIKLEYSKSI